MSQQFVTSSSSPHGINSTEISHLSMDTLFNENSEKLILFNELNNQLNESLKQYEMYSKQRDSLLKQMYTDQTNELTRVKQEHNILMQEFTCIKTSFNEQIKSLEMQLADKANDVAHLKDVLLSQSQEIDIKTTKIKQLEAEGIAYKTKIVDLKESENCSKVKLEKLEETRDKYKIVIDQYSQYTQCLDCLIIITEQRLNGTNCKRNETNNHGQFVESNLHLTLDNELRLQYETLSKLLDSTITGYENLFKSKENEQEKMISIINENERLTRQLTQYISYEKVNIEHRESLERKNMELDKELCSLKARFCIQEIENNELNLDAVTKLSPSTSLKNSKKRKTRNVIEEKIHQLPSSRKSLTTKTSTNLYTNDDDELFVDTKPPSTVNVPLSYSFMFRARPKHSFEQSRKKKRRSNI